MKKNSSLKLQRSMSFDSSIDSLNVLYKHKNFLTLILLKYIFALHRKVNLHHRILKNLNHAVI
jgi:hypothetical protein